MMNLRTRQVFLLTLCSLLPFAAWPQRSPQTKADDESSRIAAEGQQALASGQFDTARADFEQLAKLEPGIAEVHATLAAIYFKMGQYDQAVSEVHTAQKLKPSLPKLDSLLGLSEAEQGR